MYKIELYKLHSHEANTPAKTWDRVRSPERSLHNASSYYSFLPALIYIMGTLDLIHQPRQSLKLL